MIKDILLLGNPALYERSVEVSEPELNALLPVIEDLHDSMMWFRSTYGAGRAIAAPQIGVKKRLIYMHIDEPIVFINPTLHFPDEETMEVMDDCMSFPNLYVRVLRRRRVCIRYKNVRFEDCERLFEGDLAELIQHEYDHLDGILAVMRAIDDKALYLKGTF